MWAVVFAAVVSSFNKAIAQEYYVVVGTFAMNDRPAQISSQAVGHPMDTLFSMMQNEDLLQLYVVRTKDADQNKEKARALQNTIEQTLFDTSSVRTSSASVSASPGALHGGSVSTRSGYLATVPPPPVGKYFTFRVESPEGRPVDAHLYHVDLEEGRAIATYETNQLVDLLRPGESEPMAIVCNVFGYKEAPRFIDYSNPARTVDHAYLNDNGVWVIPIELQRLERGDVSLMHNVSFHEDAAILLPTSKAELDQLVLLMHSNPYYEITVHAHCNGRGKRDIRLPGGEGGYFDLSGAHEVRGRSKDLTTARAETVRAYLIDHGIEPRRIDIFSWGASDMVVRPKSEHSDMNNRIEIEFTRD